MGCWYQLPNTCLGGSEINPAQDSSWSGYYGKARLTDKQAGQQYPESLLDIEPLQQAIADTQRGRHAQGMAQQWCGLADMHLYIAEGRLIGACQFALRNVVDRIVKMAGQQGGVMQQAEDSRQILV